MHKFLFYDKFIICLYMFRALCAHHQEVKIVLYSIWYHDTCRWPSHAQVERGLVSVLAIRCEWNFVTFTQRICVSVKVNDGEHKKQQDRHCIYSITFVVCIPLYCGMFA